VALVLIKALINTVPSRQLKGPFRQADGINKKLAKVVNFPNKFVYKYKEKQT
jgi:hypothetical protein